MEIVILPLEKERMEEARRVFRLAFAKQMRFPEPDKFAPGMDYFSWRREMFPEGAWAAFDEDRLVGSVITSRWGSAGFFGPLTVDPDYWDKGVGRRLLEPVMDCFKSWGTRLEGLYTFAESPKHIALYQSYGFLPGHLIAIMVKPLETGGAETLQEYRAYSRLPESELRGALDGCREVTNALYEGLDLTREIESVAERKLGETILIGDGNAIDAFAICHHGLGTEAGLGGTYVKFGAVRPAPEAAEYFQRLIQGCETYARLRGAPRLTLGMNTARREAYGLLLRSGYRIGALGVAMHRGPNGHYHRESDFVIEDLR